MELVEELNDTVPAKKQVADDLVSLLDSLIICGRGELRPDKQKLAFGTTQTADRIALLLNPSPIDFIYCSTDEHCDISAVLMSGARKSTYLDDHVSEHILMDTRDGIEVVLYRLRAKSAEISERLQNARKPTIMVVTTSKAACHLVNEVLQAMHVRTDSEEFQSCTDKMQDHMAFAYQLKFGPGDEIHSILFP
jgi:hypothetical protein